MINKNIFNFRCIFIAVCVLFFSVKSFAFAEEQEKNIIPVMDLKTGVETQEIKKEESLLKTWLNADYATGNWKGLRTKLEDNGITFSQSYMLNNFVKEHSGGLLENSKPSYQGISNTSLEFDTEKMKLYKGGKLFVLFQNIHGKGLSDKYVGDYMYFNGYEATHTGSQLSEYWYEQRVLKDKLKLKIGKQDANSEFQALDTGFEFCHSGFNFIVNSGLPTYPHPAVGLTATIQPFENMYLKYGFFDGSAVGTESGFNTIFHKDYKYINIEEIGLTHSTKQHPGKLLVGFWQNTSNTEELLNDDQVNNAYEPITYKNNNGFYTEIEQMIFKENHKEGDTQGLTLMAQYAWAPKTKNELTQYSGVAMTYKGLLPKRNDDMLGIGANFARFSNRVGPINSERIDNKGENILEVFYKLQLTPWLYVQPDFQLVNKPYYAEKSTVVFGVRTNITF